ncbi:hypothetical protein [Enterobacter cloacae]|uniref:hypothetical protein n=1 Tax=Enterobacter cloacae TaxID=550 RepID=UPI0028F14AFB|nr:hypothetical protein [Enterobacter cloacae]WNT38689.1 hypothetical protein RRL13_11490 [Enterobacter cloacae]HDR2795518.1 hypothetical protein [Enterobacter asburiae]HDR2800899.1 hypothetical protein [Enterobacter asburiae]
MKKLTHGTVVFLFGLILPVFLLIGAYSHLTDIDEKINRIDTSKELQNNYTTLKGNLASANDYILYSLMFIEQSNQRTMLNKQSMKIAIIHIGLAVMSVGMMFIILGINDGGADGTANLTGMSFNIKTASSGLAVFIAGALMASGGALINNLYTTASIPGYVQILTSSTPEKNDEIDKTSALVGFYKSCRKYDDERFQQCLVSMVQQLYKDELK